VAAAAHETAGNPRANTVLDQQGSRRFGPFFINLGKSILQFGAGTLGVNDPAARHHQINRTGGNGLNTPDRIPMNDFPLEQAGNRGQVDVGIGNDINTLAAGEGSRSHMVEKHPRPHGLPACGRKAAADRKTAQVHHSRLDNPLNRRGKDV